jgi:prolyl-tRNA editing enzyme YbaK/EbsC (Cys-tRNA(Pro) deacylase)
MSDQRRRPLPSPAKWSRVILRDGPGHGPWVVRLPFVLVDQDREHLLALLEPLGAPYELFACDPDLADTAQFCAAYGFAMEDSANTIVVAGKADPRRYAACVVLAPHRLDVNRVVKGRLGTRKASFAGAEETRELTGMAIGGVTPFGLPPGLPVWVDAAVMSRDRIVLGGGSRSWKVIAAPEILLRLANVEVVEGLAGAPGAAAQNSDEGAAD